MTREELNAAIIDETDNIVYVVDLETYELLYMNKRAIEHFGLKGDEAEKRPLCYKTFYGQDKPCEWCKNDIIMDKGRYSFRHYIEKINKYLYQKYRMITVGGRKAKLCITTDITELMETSKELEKQLYIEKTLVQCVSTLYCHDGADSAINHLLSIIANFHCAERAYIFEFDDSELIMSNTYEWCKEGTTAHIDELQRVEISKYNKWNRQLREKGEICIASLDDEVDNQSEEYRQLKKRNINSLMAVPLRAGEKIVGFMGVDNPTENMETHLLMQSAAAFVINDITRRKNLAKLHELSHVDRLTGVGNREAYVDYINSLEGKNTSVGIIFADINGLKKTNDAYGHKRGDRVISDAAELLKSRFENNIFRVGGDEFVVFCLGMEKSDFDRELELLRESCNPDVSVAIGGIWLAECENLERNVANADAMMYFDKQKYYSDCGIHKTE